MAARSSLRKWSMPRLVRWLSWMSHVARGLRISWALWAMPVLLPEISQW